MLHVCAETFQRDDALSQPASRTNTRGVCATIPNGFYGTLTTPT